MTKCAHEWNHAKAMCTKCGVLAKAKGIRYTALRCSVCDAEAISMIALGDFRCAEHEGDGGDG
jgi:hypothetical protein